jgi:hypothetical protein
MANLELIDQGISLVDNEYISVVYLEEINTVYHTIRQPVSGQIFRDALEIGTQAMEEYGACKWLSDDRKNGPVSPDDAAWAANGWYARTIGVGWKYWANVVPEEILAAEALTPVIKDLYDLGLRTVLFTSLEKAMDWLNKCEC